MHDQHDEGDHVACIGYLPASLSSAIVAQPLDLVGDVDALVGDDPLQHPHPLLEPLVARHIAPPSRRSAICASSSALLAMPQDAA